MPLPSSRRYIDLTLQPFRIRDPTSKRNALRIRYDEAHGGSLVGGRFGSASSERACCRYRGGVLLLDDIQGRRGPIAWCMLYPLPLICCIQAKTTCDAAANLALRPARSCATRRRAAQVGAACLCLCACTRVCTGAWKGGPALSQYRCGRGEPNIAVHRGLSTVLCAACPRATSYVASRPAFGSKAMHRGRWRARTVICCTLILCARVYAHAAFMSEASSTACLFVCYAAGHSRTHVACHVPRSEPRGASARRMGPCTVHALPCRVRVRPGRVL